MLSVITADLFAQGFSGQAIYQSSNGIQLSFHSTSMSPQEMQRLKADLARQMQKSYVLDFNSKESLWHQMESLDSGPAKASSGGMDMVISSGSAKDKLYRNLEDGLYRNSEELMGKRFLIIDSLPKYEWKISNETKKIGEYTVRKAIYTRIAESKRFATGMEEMEVVQDTTQIEAWFSMDIPVAHGPIQYFGLPGLILELKADGRPFICSEIKMNYKEGITIEVPNQGKKVNDAEYKAISDEKFKEMMQRYQGHGEGSNIEIVIGG